jgi:hypothetical protein
MRVPFAEARMRRILLAASRIARSRQLPALRWASAEAAAAGPEEQLHAVLVAHCPSLTLSAVRKLVALEPGLASSPDAMQAAAFRCAALATTLPNFTELYPHHDVAVLLAGGPRVFERLVARGRPPGVQAPAPATLLRLTKELKSDFGDAIGDLRAAGDELLPPLPPPPPRAGAVHVEDEDDDSEWGVVDDSDSGRRPRPLRRGAKTGSRPRRRGAADDL